MKFKVRAQFLRENMEKHIDYLAKEIATNEREDICPSENYIHYQRLVLFLVKNQK